MKYKISKDNNYTYDSLFDMPFFKFNRLTQVMRSDIIETDDFYKIFVEVPGYEKDEIKLITSNGYLEIFIEKKPKEEENVNYIHKERHFGEYTRKFYVGNINKNNIDASLKNGVLELTVFKNKEIENDNYIEIK